MSRYDTVGSHKTSIRTEDSRTIVRYHQTDVVAFDATTILLNSGGYRTATTKLRMNQTAHQFGLGYSVFQSKGAWFVRTFEDANIHFTDGIILLR